MFRESAFVHHLKYWLPLNNMWLSKMSAPQLQNVLPLSPSQLSNLCPTKRDLPHTQGEKSTHTDINPWHKSPFSSTRRGSMMVADFFSFQLVVKTMNSSSKAPATDFKQQSEQKSRMDDCFTCTFLIFVRKKTAYLWALHLVCSIHLDKMSKTKSSMNTSRKGSRQSSKVHEVELKGSHKSGLQVLSSVSSYSKLVSLKHYWLNNVIPQVLIYASLHLLDPSIYLRENTQSVLWPHRLIMVQKQVLLLRLQIHCVIIITTISVLTDFILVISFYTYSDLNFHLSNKRGLQHLNQCNKRCSNHSSPQSYCTLFAYSFFSPFFFKTWAL